MSTDGERSPKRQRRSYSPPSPDTKPFVSHQPQTPPPSVHMSPSWQGLSQTSTLQQQHNSGSVPFPTPPSTSGVFGAVRGAGSDGGESGQHTPAHVDEETQAIDGDGDAEMADARQDAGEGEDDMSTTSAPPAKSDDAQRAPTNHDRHPPPPTNMLPPPPPRLYSLRTKPLATPRPRPAQDLIDLYSLQGLQASVARRDDAGNKINKLRKSYEGKAKALGLEGRAKAQAGNGALAGLVDPAWELDAGSGRTWWDAQRGSEVAGLLGEKGDALDMLALLPAAFQGLGREGFPKKEHEHWRHVLGLDEAGTTPALPATKPNGVFPAALGKGATTPAQATALRNAASPVSPNGVVRPERAGKKRRYDEASYTGYHEGFVDDDGYSTGGDSSGLRGSAGKRQKTGAGPAGVGGATSVAGAVGGGGGVRKGSVLVA
ncbi:hypothetical protein LTR53_013017 [Teratosphaeriaceae sp. CCFEE 6253]|nr:hypothetical protein LTR53_013017 [Teratosphaeriaceae sp. CCFEE 6253]